MVLVSLSNRRESIVVISDRGLSFIPGNPYLHPFIFYPVLFVHCQVPSSMVSLLSSAPSIVFCAVRGLQSRFSSHPFTTVKLGRSC